MALKALAGGALFAHRSGSGRPLVLALHGWGRQGGDYAAVLDGLDGLALDLPGFGASPPPEEPGGAEAYAALIEPALAEFPEPPVVLGHSFGGRVAVVLASRRPEAVAGLVLTGVPLLRLGGAATPGIRFRLARRAHRLGLVSADRMEAIRRRSGSADYRAARGVMREILVRVVGESYEAELASMRCPVRLVWGAEDREVPPAVAEAALELLRRNGVDARLQVLPGAGHLVPIEAPGELRAAVDSLLS